MHELSIAKSVIESVERLVEDRGLDKPVLKVCLKVGKLSTVVPEYLQFAFEALVDDSKISGARLEIESTAVRGRCKKCDFEFEIEDILFVCPKCKFTGVETTSGQDLVIDFVEVED